MIFSCTISLCPPDFLESLNYYFEYKSESDAATGGVV